MASSSHVCFTGVRTHHELRGKLDCIPLHAADAAAVAHLNFCQHVLQGMAEPEQEIGGQ